MVAYSADQWADSDNVTQANTEPARPQIVAVASGKGGVGKTLTCFGMAWYLSKVGYRVVVVDLDFGVGNLHLSAGIGRLTHSLDDWLRDPTQELGSSLTPLPDNYKLSILASGGRNSSATQLDERQKQALLEQLPRLDADIVMLDIGAGAAQDNIDYFLRADHHVAVATTDLSSMTALIAFLKKALIHRILISASASYPNLATLAHADYARVAEVFMAFSKHLGETSARAVLQQALKDFRPAVVLNRVEPGDLAQIERVNKNLMRQLNATTAVIGTIPDDPAITRCRRQGQNFLLLAPESNVASALASISSQWHEQYCNEVSR